MKINVLGISPNLISTHSAESMPVTVALAEAGKKCFRKLTGLLLVQACLNQAVATPDKPEGTFFAAVYDGLQTHQFQYYIKGTTGTSQ